MKHFYLAAIACVAASPSFSDIRVQFLEGAPKDRFVITNQGQCALEAAQVEIDLSGSEAGLILMLRMPDQVLRCFSPLK